MTKIHPNQSINCLLTEEKKQELNNPKAFIGYSQTNDDVYENLEGYNPTKKKRALTVYSFLAEFLNDIDKFSNLKPRNENTHTKQGV